MATTLGTLRTRARRSLNETTARFWADDELLDHAIDAVKDLWGHIKDTYQDYFFTVVENVALAANGTTLTSVPADVAEVRRIEVADAANHPQVVFTPKPYNHNDFTAARAMAAQDPQHGMEILYAITGAGGPIGAPTIYVAPKVSTALTLRMMYVPTFGALTADSNNPIPGESDHAIVCWILAHALGKQNPDGTLQPDAGWLAKYNDQRDRIMTRVTPRQTQEPPVAEALFGEWWEN